MSTKKRKAVSASGMVEGFSVFKSSKLAPSNVVVLKETDGDGYLKERKEMYRQMERDAILRKKHNIHVSGSNVPSPLQDFAELRTRFRCKSYLLRNIAERGFKEPTPIRRQAIPVLESACPGIVFRSMSLFFFIMFIGIMSEGHWFLS